MEALNRTSPFPQTGETQPEYFDEKEKKTPEEATKIIRTNIQELCSKFLDSFVSENDRGFSSLEAQRAFAQEFWEVQKQTVKIIQDNISKVDWSSMHRADRILKIGELYNHGFEEFKVKMNERCHTTSWKEVCEALVNSSEHRFQSAQGRSLKDFL